MQVTWERGCDVVCAGMFFRFKSPRRSSLQEHAIRFLHNIQKIKMKFGEVFLKRPQSLQKVVHGGLLV